MRLLGLCGRVPLHAVLFSRKHAFIQCAGLLNETGRVAVAIRLRELDDFAHLISRKGTTHWKQKAKIVPARRHLGPVLNRDRTAKGRMLTRRPGSLCAIAYLGRDDVDGVPLV